MSKIFKFLIFAFWIGTFSVQAQQDTTKLFKSSVSEVLSMKKVETENKEQIITTASKNEETIQAAAAIVSVISEREIALFGALTLTEVLNRVVGTWTYSTYNIPKNIFSIRGSITANDNFHVLILINGRPSRENLRNGQNSAFYNSFPLHIIKQIEVVRGPGSVLYGSAAFMGIVNIITKEAATQDEHISVRYGTFESYQLSLSGGTQRGNLGISGGLNYLKTEGWKFSAVDENGRSGEFDMGKELIGANLNLTYKNLSVNTYYGNSSQDAMGNLPRFAFLTPASPAPLRFRVTTPRFFVDLGYKKEITPFWTASFNLTNNYGEYKTSRPTVGFETLQLGHSNGLLAELTHFFQFKKFSLIVGGVANRLSGDYYFYDRTANGNAYDITRNTELTPNPFIAVSPFVEMWYSAYFQANYKLKTWLSVVGGGQLNKVHNSKADFVPRLGAIATFENGLGAKLLYGQAFRAPIGLETDLKNLGTLYGNPNLTPEKNATTEFQLSYKSKKVNLAFTLFQVNQRNLITRSSPRDSLLVIDGKKNATPIFINQAQLAIRGFELEGKWEISNRFYAILSVAYQNNIDDKNQKNYLGTPNTILKGGLAYQSLGGFSAGIFNTYAGQVQPITIFDAQNRPLTREVNGAVKQFHWLTANFSFDLKKYYKSSKKMSAVLNLYITNVLNQKIYYAEYIRRNVNSIQGEGERAIYVSLTGRF